MISLEKEQINERMRKSGKIFLKRTSHQKKNFFSKDKWNVKKLCVRPRFNFMMLFLVALTIVLNVYEDDDDDLLYSVGMKVQTIIFILACHVPLNNFLFPPIFYPWLCLKIKMLVKKRQKQQRKV